MFEKIDYLLNKTGLKIVKVMSLSNKKYILYRTHPVLNQITISNNNKQDLLEDLIYFLDSNEPGWFLEINNQDLPEKSKYRKAINEVDAQLRYRTKRVNKVINDPANDLFFTENNTTYFNIFQNTELLVNPPVVEYDWDIVHQVIWNLCGEDEEIYDWVFNWLTVLYQFPAHRFTTSLIFIGEHGSGKGMLSNILAEVFGKTCYRANSRDLISTFNAQLFEGNFLVLCNEIVDQKNTYQFSNELKEIVTEKEVSTEQKYFDRYLAKNYVKLIMFSNDSNPIYIEQGDRRYLVAKSKKIKIEYTKLQKFFEDENFFRKQVLGFCYALNNNIPNFEKVTKEPPMTEAKEDIINNFLTDFNVILQEILENLCDKWVKDINGDYYIDYSEVYNEYACLDKVKHIYRKKFGSRLRAEGFILIKNTIDGVTNVRLKIPHNIFKNMKPVEYNHSQKYSRYNLSIRPADITYNKNELCRALNILDTDIDEINNKIKLYKKQGIIYEIKNGVYKIDRNNHL